MASSSNQAGELERMMLIVEQMMRSRDNDASVEKAVDRVVELEGQFDGRNVTKFLDTYRREMNQRDVSEARQIASFKRVVANNVQRRVIELQEGKTTWSEFEKTILAEFATEDSTRMTRHALMKWIEKKNKKMSASRVYDEFDQMFSRLPNTDQVLLEEDKTLYFLKAVDMKDRRELGTLLEDDTQANGLVADWIAVKRACNRLDKRRQWVDDTDLTGSTTTEKARPPKVVEPPKQSNAEEKKIGDDIIEELAKKFETVTLANMNRRGPKGKEPFRCVWCDGTDHMRRDCSSLRDAIRQNIVYIDDNMICSSETRRPLRVNFGRGGMKKAMEDADATHVDAMHYAASAGIRVGKDKTEAARAGAKFWTSVLEYEKKGKVTSNEVELADRSVQSITGWSDPVDDNTILAEVMCDNHEVFVEEKRKRIEEQGPSKRHETRNAKKKEDAETSRPLQSEERESSRKEESSKKVEEADRPMRVNVEDPARKSRTMPTYKLRSDIEQTTDLKKILEERVLDSHVTLSLRELLGIAKKEFHDTIVDLVKRKRQQSDEEEERPQKAKTNAITMAKDEVEEDMVDSHYTRPHWARATTETPVKIGEKKETVVALIDHGSEINLMSTEVYKKGRWPINTNHGWKIRAATKATEDLYGACPSIPITIGDVEIDQHFFVQDSASHPIILGQPYITSSRMETKVFDNGAAFARVKSLDGKKAVQFLTVRANHERNRDSLGGDASDF